MDASTIALIVSALTGGAALAGSMLVVRRYQKLGGGEAQDKLNTLLTETISTLEANVTGLDAALVASRTEFVTCKATLSELGDEVSRMRRERIYLRQDIDDLHDEVRLMRKATTARADERGLQQDARDVRQDAQDTRQDAREAAQ